LLKDPSLEDALTIGRTSPGKEFRFQEINLSENTDYSSVLNKIDVIVHLAAKVNLNSVESKDDFRKINFLYTMNLARQAVHHGVKRFIFMSSIKVLGEENENKKPFSLNDPFNPKDSYGISKAEAEMGLMNLSKDSNMEFVIIRPPLVYGPGVKGNFRKLLKLSSRSFPLPLGSIKNKRSMISIHNLIDIICLCIKSDKAKNKVFLVSDDHDLSTPDLLSEISHTGSHKSRIFNFPLILIRFILLICGKSKFYQRICGSLEIDITQTKKELDWKPPFTVKESLIKCWEHYN